MKKKLLITALVLVLLIEAVNLFVGAWYAKSQVDEKNLRIEELKSKISKLESKVATPSAENISETEGEYSKDIVEKARKVGVEARKSVIYLTTQIGPGGSGNGTGWFIKKGLLITNGHVVENVSSIKGITIDGDTFTAQVINSSLVPDIAVLKTDYTKAPPLVVGSSAKLKKGDPLVQVGHPGGIGNWVITLGEFVKKQEEDIYGNVPGVSGVSGSPILTIDGKVVGLTSGSTPVDDVAIEPGASPTNSQVYQAIPEKEIYSTHDSIERILQKVDTWVK